MRHMIVTHQNSVSYRDGNVVLTIETTTTTSPAHGGMVSKDTYYLEIDGETKRMNDAEFASLKRIIKAMSGIEE